jgi:hypothetical protein
MYTCCIYTNFYPKIKCFPLPPHVRHGLHGLPSQLWPKCNRLPRLGVVKFVRMRWMVIHEYGVPEGALNLHSTNYPDHGDPPLSGKNPHDKSQESDPGPHDL